MTALGAQRTVGVDVKLPFGMTSQKKTAGDGLFQVTRSSLPVPTYDLRTIAMAMASKCSPSMKNESRRSPSRTKPILS
jgi:hypothetical protein